MQVIVHFSEVVKGNRHMSYNYSSSSYEIQPLLDGKPIEVPPARRDKAPSGMSARAGVVLPLTPYHIPSQLVSSPPLLAPGGSGEFSIWIDGSLMSVKKPRTFVRGRKGVYLRGPISGFSASARRRMMRRVAKLRTDARPIFVTLTYPGEFSVDWSVWKNDLEKFAFRFHRRFPDGGFIWRLEPQGRMAPHYHLLVYGVDYGADSAKWFKEAWYGCVASGDERHLRHGVHLEPIRSARGVRSYVSKYIAKKQSLPADSEGVDWSKVGRWWGVRFGDNLPDSEVFSSSGLTEAESVRLLRTMRNFLRSAGRKVSGCLSGLTMFTEAPRQWANAIDGLIGAKTVGSGSFLDVGRGFT